MGVSVIFLHAGLCVYFTDLDANVTVIDICDRNGETIEVDGSLVLLSHSGYIDGDPYPNNVFCQVCSPPSV